MTLRGNADSFTRSMGDASAAAKGADSRISSMGKATAGMGLAVAAAGVGVSVAAVKMASDFQTQMTRLYTAAGAPKKVVQDSYGAVLQMATSVGMSGTKMAEALYHPISAGLSFAQALQAVKYSAMEAQISGANLDDTTYALSSVLKAFNIPAADTGKTMALLNGIVGEGDMHFQDFNASIKNWSATANQMGVSIQSMGAGLAYLTDRGTPAEEASTRLTMGLTMMTTPTLKATKLLVGLGDASTDVHASSQAMTDILKKSGVTQNQLAADLRKPDGLYVALKQLKDSLMLKGVTGDEANSVLSKVFGGGRSDKAILQLMQNLDGLKDKYNKIGADSTPAKFAQDWADTQKTFSYQLKQFEVSIENGLLIPLGLKLIPIVEKVMTGISKLVGWFEKHRKVAAELGAAIGGVLVVALGAAAVAIGGMVAGFLSLTWPVIAAGAAIGVLAKYLIGLYEHNAKFRAFVNKIAADVKQYLGEAVAWVEANGPRIWATIKDVFGKVSSFTVQAFGVVRDIVRSVMAAVTGWISDHRDQINTIFGDVAKTVRSIADIFQSAFDLVVAVVNTAVKIIEDLWSRFGNHLIQHVRTQLNIIWDTFRRVFTALLQIVRGAFELMKGILDVFVGIFTGNWHKFLNGLSEIFGGAWNMILGAFKGVWAMIEGVVRTGINWVSTVIGAGMAVISAIWGFAWHSVETLFRNIWSSIRRSALSALDLLYQLFTSLPGRVIGAILGLQNQILSWALNVMQSMLSGFTRGWAKVIGWIAGIPQAISATLLNIGSDMLNIGNNVVIGIWNGIANMSDWLYNKVADFAKNAVTSPIKSVLKIFSPSRVMKDEVGKFIPMGLALGITDNLGLVNTARQKMAAAAVGGPINAASTMSLAARATAAAPLGAGALGMGGGGNLTLQVIVQGSVLAERELMQVIKRELANDSLRGGTISAIARMANGRLRSRVT